MKHPPDHSKDLVAEFVLASKNKDLKSLKRILSKDGEFHIQDSSFNVIAVSKPEFLEWYKERLYASAIESVDYDQCIFCLIGSPVVLFNNGKFPRPLRDNTEVSKTGLMFNIVGSKIYEISFCYRFLATENKHIYEITGDRIRKYMEDGLSTEEAVDRGEADELKEFNIEKNERKVPYRLSDS